MSYGLLPKKGMTQSALLAALADPESAIYQAVAAIGGGGGGVVYPDRQGFYDSSSAYDATLATEEMSANQLYAVPVLIPQALEFKSLRLTITSGAGNARYGLYAMKTDGFATYRGAPGALITDLGEIDVSTTGDKWISHPNPDPVLDAGIYWLAVVFDNTPTVNSISAASAAIGIQANPVAYFSGYRQSHTFGALPDPFSANPGAFVAEFPHMIASFNLPS